MTVLPKKIPPQQGLEKLLNDAADQRVGALEREHREHMDALRKEMQEQRQRNTQLMGAQVKVTFSSQNCPGKIIFLAADGSAQVSMIFRGTLRKIVAQVQTDGLYASH